MDIEIKRHDEVPPECGCTENVVCIYPNEPLAISRNPRRVPNTSHRWNGVPTEWLSHVEAVNDAFLQGLSLHDVSSRNFPRDRMKIPVQMELVPLTEQPTETELQITVLVLASIRAELRRRSNT